MPPARECSYVYVMGRGHSGSTVLDALLGNGANVRGIGEVVAGLDGTHPCSCGASVDACPYWREVRAALVAATETGADEAVWRQTVEAVAGRATVLHVPKVLAASPSSAFVTSTRRALRSLADAIRRVSGVTHVVDSSKELSRGLFLARFVPEARVIHLVRRPTRMMASNLHRLRDGTGFVFLRRRFRSEALAPLILGLSALSWTVGNLLCELARTLAPDRVLRVRYEDLCERPGRELDRIAAFTGLDLDRVHDAIRHKRELPIEHKLAGNRMATRGAFVFEPERSQGRPIPAHIERIGRLLTRPLSAYYGYD